MFGREVRAAAWTVAVLLGVLGPLLGRAAWEGRGALALAQQEAAAGRVDREILQLGRAARWRVPIAGHDEQALARLMVIGAEAEGEADRQTALAAYREVRGALLATRAWGVADPALLDAADQGVARLMAAQEQAFGTDLSGTGRAEAFHLALLRRTGAARRPWSAAAAVCTVLAGAMALRGGPGRARLLWVALAVLGAVAAWALRPG